MLDVFTCMEILNITVGLMDNDLEIQLVVTLKAMYGVLSIGTPVGCFGQIFLIAWSRS